MAKTAKLKKPSKPPSAHSRASRRVSPPTPNLHTPHPRPQPHPSPLAPLAHDKITKTKKKGGKILKRKQKLRLEHGREKAEAVMEKMERKVERAGGRREGIRGRNTGWDELNERIGGRRGRRRGGEVMGDREDEGWEDEEVGVKGGGLDGEKGGGNGDGVGGVGLVEDEIS